MFPLRFGRVSAVVVSLVALLGCSAGGDRRPNAIPSSNVPASNPLSDPPAGEGSIVISTAAPSIALDRRLFGSNAPAWIGPERLADPVFQHRTVDSGATVLRMPGGSWSSTYDWLACENGDATGCFWTWAAKPSDYASFLGATRLDGMWTVSFNETAQQASALVAYFNGTADDTRPIGIDRNGTDWGTVGKWASLRAQHGNVDPQPIHLWEVGNEVYGAKSGAGAECADFGWEEVWTCDGNAYINGDDGHDGFLAFREAMRAVDPTILVGAVGIPGAQDQWTNFGNEVIDGAKGVLDFYVVHDYGFNSAPSQYDVSARPLNTWPGLLTDARDALAAADPSATVPIAITEYNMFAFQDGDTDGVMSQAISAFYIADTIGQMAGQGVTIANQWNLLNGVSATGSDYGMIDADTGEPHPQFFALALWSRIGDEMLAVDADFDPVTSLDAYAGRSADGTINVLVLNKASEAMSTTMRIDGVSGSMAATADVVTASALDAATMSWNGASTFDTLASQPAADLGPIEAAGFEHTYPPLSMTLLHLTPT
jgi:hypothetical protein